ncbi:MAG: bifunctional heptose 7-phosphate kinase/heptose 1-phosphate adenyltransferase [Planctomycetes bacterium]|nr:bifunctional heptose 7-phosphate kinase/heptose 1-phosphate adenyltransferase [Planctomycetota bacterium]
MPHSLQDLMDALGRPRIAVVGDMMLDTYVRGDVSRISPEGPIPVLRVEKREQRPGGAGSVAAMLAGFGADALPVGLVGEDAAAETLRRLLEAAPMDASGLVSTELRPTITKARYLGYVQSAGRAVQQIVRVDEELTHPLSVEEADAVAAAAESALERCDLLIIQDMGKGIFDDELVGRLIERGARLGKPVVVDPERRESYARYRGATCLLPNRYEAQIATGLTLRSDKDYARAARQLLDDLELDCALVKLDRDGMCYATRAGEEKRITTQTLEVADVTGAGDMVTAAFAVALAGGAGYHAAAKLANFCAGLEVNQSGATPLSRAQIMEALDQAEDPVSRKIVPRDQIEQLVDGLRARGSAIAFTNGCFDLLHLGHVQLIQHASRQADVLIVGLNSDSSARELKGAGRPVNSEQVRSRILASLADVDYVVIFEEKSVLPLIRQLRPDVLVKGGDYDEAGVVGREFVESYGGQVKLAPLAEGFSTTELIGRIGRNHEGKN